MKSSSLGMLLLLSVIVAVSCEPYRQDTQQPPVGDSDKLVLYFMSPNILTRVPVTPDLIKKWYSAKIELRDELRAKLTLTSRPLPHDIRILVDRVGASGDLLATYGYVGKDDFGQENWKLVEAFGQ